jgi:hypothetical protein
MNTKLKNLFSTKTVTKKYFVTVFVLVLFCSSVLAQKDTNYIVQFERPYNIQTNTWLNDFGFYINPPRFSYSKEVLKLSPNISLQTGISLGLKYFTVAFGVQIPRTSGNEDKFGRTNYFDFSFSYYQMWGGGEIYSRSFVGAYRIRGNDSNVSIRPDAKIEDHGLNFFYNFNYKKFSYRSALSMAEFQKKSSGAFLIMGNAGIKSIRADSSLIPNNIDSVKNYGELTGMNFLRLWRLNFRPGYAYNFCFKGGKWFISPSAFLGLGIAAYKINNNKFNETGTSLEFDTHAKLSIGKNGNKYFWNVFVTYDGNLNAFNYPNFVAFQSTSIGVNLGYRFYKLIPKIKWL